MKEKPAEIVITAPKGWGKGWYAEQIAGALVRWKAGRVIIKDDGGIIRTVDNPFDAGRLGARIVARITLKHQED